MKAPTLATFKGQWRELQHSAPGHRFQNRYTNARKHGAQTPVWFRALRIGLALVLVATGVIFAFIPGPAILFFAFAGALLAAESRVVARSLDWTELRLRALWKWAHRRWHRLGTAGRVFVVTLGVAGAAGAAFIAWLMFFR